MHPLPPTTVTYHRPKTPSTPQAASTGSKSGPMLSSARNSTLFSPGRRGSSKPSPTDLFPQPLPTPGASDSASKSKSSAAASSTHTTSSINLAHILGLGQQRDSINLPRKQLSSGSLPNTLTKADERELSANVSASAGAAEAGASFEQAPSSHQLGRRGIVGPGASERPLYNDEHHAMKKKGWFEEVYVKGSLTPQRYCAAEHDEASYWPGYSLQAMDKEMVLSSVFTSGQVSIHATWAHTPKPPDSSTLDTRPALPPPKRALDLGCGPLSIWSVGTASRPGWEATHFVGQSDLHLIPEGQSKEDLMHPVYMTAGLDVAPSQLPLQYLPSHIADRLSYVQHNYFTPLPFDDAEFDLVRLCDLGCNMPEHQWDFVIEEATRVLSIDGVIEIIERPINVYGQRALVSNSILDPEHSTSSKVDPYYARVQACLDAVFDRRFVNPYGIHIIPTSVCLNLNDVKSTGLLTAEVPSERVPPNYNSAPQVETIPSIPASHNVEDEEEEKDCVISELVSFPALYDFSSIHLGKKTKFELPTLDTLLLATEADKLAACSYQLAHEGALARMREEERKEGPRTKSASEGIRFAKLRSELVDSIHTHCANLRQHADLARLLSDKETGWGWTCRMDEEAMALRLSNQPVLEQRIAECVKMLDQAMRREASQGMTRGDIEAGLDTATMEMRLAHARFAKREAEQEVRALELRLGIAKEGLNPGELGTAALCCWVATKKAPVMARP
ncbi:BQ2448_5218 [Microbotryum intermedium]|uniref:BQ2448_5218 protein n=1 Tax=Microbotryum intermedium TaxID=269621 RepID=A0A238F3I0_9BASI|nr:BQ2448_5218 [Microbotryum intermedium]